MQDMYLHFSDLETTLLPYFLFVVYGAIVLWARSESLDREYVEPEPEPEPVLNFDHDFPQDFLLSVPMPSQDLVTEFSLEVLTRELTATDNHFSPEAADFLLAESGLPAVALQALVEELDKVSPPFNKPKRRKERSSSGEVSLDEPNQQIADEDV